MGLQSFDVPTQFLVQCGQRVASVTATAQDGGAVSWSRDFEGSVVSAVVAQFDGKLSAFVVAANDGASTVQVNVLELVSGTTVAVNKLTVDGGVVSGKVRAALTHTRTHSLTLTHAHSHTYIHTLPLTHAHTLGVRRRAEYSRLDGRRVFVDRALDGCDWSATQADVVVVCLPCVVAVDDHVQFAVLAGSLESPTSEVTIAAPSADGTGVVFVSRKGTTRLTAPVGGVTSVAAAVTGGASGWLLPIIVSTADGSSQVLAVTASGATDGASLSCVNCRRAVARSARVANMQRRCGIVLPSQCWASCVLLYGCVRVCVAVCIVFPLLCSCSWRVSCVGRRVVHTGVARWFGGIAARPRRVCGWRVRPRRVVRRGVGHRLLLRLRGCVLGLQRDGDGRGCLHGYRRSHRRRRPSGAHSRPALPRRRRQRLRDW